MEYYGYVIVYHGKVIVDLWIYYGYIIVYNVHIAIYNGYTKP